jgi:hypothetical protein
MLFLYVKWLTPESDCSAVIALVVFFRVGSKNNCKKEGVSGVINAPTYTNILLFSFLFSISHAALILRMKLGAVNLGITRNHPQHKLLRLQI